MGLRPPAVARLLARHPLNAPHNEIDDNCECYQCQVTRKVVEYMMWSMEPTDRALWPYPAPRLGMTEPPPPGAPR